MKRIALISFHTCPLAPEEGKETGGMNVYVREVATKLAQNGFIVDVFTRKQDHSQDNIVEVTPGFRVIHLPAGPLGFVHRNNLYEYVSEFSKQLFQFIDSQNKTYDIIDCHYWLSGVIGEKLQKHLSNHPPIFMTFHRIALMKNLLTKQEEKEESEIRLKSELHIVTVATKIITPSQTDSIYLQKLYNTPEEKIAIITPGVDTTLFHPMDKLQARKQTGAAENEKIVLFVGRPEPDKGIDTLLYAFKMFRETYPAESLKLWIIGGDVEKPVEKWNSVLQKLVMLVDTLGLTDNVDFIERKYSKELPVYLNSANLIGMPSLYESFGMIALEALACGTPVVTTTTAGISEIIEKKYPGLVISPNNPLQLFTRLEKILLATKIDQEKVRSSCIEHIDELSWQTIAKKISDLYENVLSV